MPEYHPVAENDYLIHVCRRGWIEVKSVCDHSQLKSFFLSKQHANAKSIALDNVSEYSHLVGHFALQELILAELNVFGEQVVAVVGQFLEVLVAVMMIYRVLYDGLVGVVELGQIEVKILVSEGCEVFVFQGVPAGR